MAGWPEPGDVEHLPDGHYMIGQGSWQDENEPGEQSIMEPLDHRLLVCAAQTDPRGFGSRYIDQYREGFEDLALRHPKEWKTYGRLWLVGMNRADEIEVTFRAGHDYYAATWIKTERQKDGTSDLTFHATEWGAFKFVGKRARDAVPADIPKPLESAERVGAGDIGANKAVSKTVVVRWPYPDRPIPFPFSAVGGGELSDV
jgi:hypothetical protein